MSTSLTRNMLRFASSIFIIATGLAVWAEEAASPSSEPLEFFEKEVRPLLAANCFECHGPEKQESGLRLDHITTILNGGERGPALVPGAPEESRLVEAIRYKNEDLQMPPDGKLPSDAVATLRTWISLGAPWPDEAPPAGGPMVEPFDLESRRASHWAWQPIARVAPPQVKTSAWPQSPIDRFVLAKLEDAGLTPAPRADRRTLARRIYFDLIGLPPTPAQLDTFLADTSPSAFAKLVDELLDSPAFGERWARHWLDLVRFAETYGHESDYPIRHAWQYRDYVIRALNEDVPYDQFVREHIAGDLFESPRRNRETHFNESIIGTGFWYFHQATHAPVDVVKDEADRIDNQIDVMGKTFLGLTLACARCHDHKFDAISTEDYYSLTGYLRSSRQQFAYLDPNDEIAEARTALTTVYEKASDAFRATLKERATTDLHVAEYLEGAYQVIQGEWRPGDGARFLKPDVLFEDFETDSYADWSVEGEAFGDEPRKAGRGDSSRANEIIGKKMSSSRAGDEKAEGRLLSRPFLIERSRIHFLIAGGKVPEKTCVNLRVSGEIVRTATGRGNDVLSYVQWEVDEFEGLVGVIEIVDEVVDKSGYIQADHFVFTESEFLRAIQRPVDVVSQELDLEPIKLSIWVRALQDPLLNGVDHPLHAWRAMTTNRDDATPESFSSRREKVAQELARSAASAREATAPFVVFEDFNDAPFDGWFMSGHAFRDQTTTTGDLYFSPSARPVDSGILHSGMLSDKLEGTMRSPTFTIGHDNIHFRIAGRGAQVRLIIHRYALREYNGLLFEETLFDVNTGGKFIWHNMSRSLKKFRGRNAYIEIIDDGNGYVAIDEIRFSDGAPPRSEPHGLATAILGDDGDALESRVELATSYEETIKKAMGRIADGVEHDGSTTLLNWFLDAGLIEALDDDGELAAHASRRSDLSEQAPRPLRAVAMMDGTIEPASIFIRGDHKTPGAPTERRFLEALAGATPAQIASGSGRLGLAEWIASPDNPLTARVMVNRVWHHLFGRGLVPTTDDFGVMGQAPSHPELLDALALSFQEDGWSLKKLIRRLLNSSVYQMSSTPADAAGEEIDPSNILLHRMPLRRLEGEVLRDAVLAVAGTIDRTMFGPSVAIHLSPFMGGHRRPGRSGPMNGDLRRTLYVEVRRNFLSPMMLAFDGPIPDSTKGRRNVSNIPAQALTLMNDPFIGEQALSWGKRVVADASTSAEERIESMYLDALGRPPNKSESKRMRAFLERQAHERGLTKEEAHTSETLWADLCHVMFMLKEFIFIA